MVQCRDKRGKQIEQINPAFDYYKIQKGYNFGLCKDNHNMHCQSRGVLFTLLALIYSVYTTIMPNSNFED